MSSYKLDRRTHKWIKKGRGKGSGKDYLPWLTIHDFSSSGRSHRIWGTKTQRTHHLFSDLELKTFLFLEWHTSVEDIREQFPLIIDDTVEIAEQHSISHPRFGEHLKVMSSDFLVDTNNKNCPQFAIQVKYNSQMFEKRTVEKIRLERLYWQRKGIPYFIITEEHIPKAVSDNMKWLYPAQSVIEDLQEIHDLTSRYFDFFQSNPNVKISQAAVMIDQIDSLPPGESLQKMRSLMAQRVFTFDISKDWKKLCVNELNAIVDVELLRNRYAANQ